MDFEEFLKKRQINLNQIQLKLCEEGIRRMKQSLDVHHSYGHVKGLLTNLDKIINIDPTIYEKTDFGILLPAICWHDVWKSTLAPNNSIFVFIFREFYDGYGSNQAFKKYISGLNFDKGHLQSSKISYCILRHARLINVSRAKEQVYKPMKHYEAKVLCDIDMLDAWKPERLEVLKKSYLYNGGANDAKLLFLGKMWFIHKMEKLNDDVFFLDASKKVFAIQKEKVFEIITSTWNMLHKYVDTNNPSIARALKLDLKKHNLEGVRDYYAEFMALQN